MLLPLKNGDPLAEQGNAKAQSSLGYLYKMGQGVTQDYKEALKWVRLSAEQEFAPAQFSLGNSYHNGQGVSIDKVKAMYWYNKASNNGSIAATHNLANMLISEQDKDDIKPDWKRAETLFKEVIKNGNKRTLVPAITSLGWIYLMADDKWGVKNYKLAHKWSVKGCNLGGTNACSNAALMYFAGLEVEQDFSKMVSYLIQSIKLYSEDFDWILEGSDEWLEYKDKAPESFWKAREIYWNAIITKDLKHIYLLQDLLYSE